MTRTRPVCVLLWATMISFPSPTFAQGRPDTSDDEAVRERGRIAFKRGLDLYHEHKWSDAVVALREAAAARDSAVIQFNIALCERALGHYVQALRALKNVGDAPAGLDEEALAEVRERTAEMESLIVRVTAKLEPAGAALSVDNRAIELLEQENTYAVSAAARALDETTVTKPVFTLWLDPGVHIFRASRAGHAAAVVNRTYGFGERAALDLHLDHLPATLRIESKPEKAIVRLDGYDLGNAPIEVQRAAGDYTITSLLPNYDDFEVQVSLAPGEQRTVVAALQRQETQLLTRWWFWALVASAVGGAGVITYFVTRPDPQPRPYDAGNTGWLVELR